MKILYLAAFKANHPNWNITYQDINGKRDIDGDMMNVDLDPYDVIIATPPCNYYSVANHRRNTSEYSQKTKHLLPDIIAKVKASGKPYLIENVRNYPLMKSFYDQDYVYEYGRHTYWTNIPFNPNNIKQIKEFTYKIMSNGKRGMFTPSNQRQGGTNVHNVVEHWLEYIKDLI
jgi:site-specific DNA-cytosine methylase